MKKTSRFPRLLIALLLPAHLLLLSACGGGSGETVINNVSGDTLIVELYKADFNPKRFEIWKEQVCIDDSGRHDGPTIACEKIWIDNFRAVLYKSIDTIALKNKSDCIRWEHTNQEDGLATQNQVEILYFNGKAMKLRFHILPGNNLALGFGKYFKTIKPPFNWDTVTVYRKDLAAFRISENTLKDHISDSVVSRSCGDCGMEHRYNINIK